MEQSCFVHALEFGAYVSSDILTQYYTFFLLI